MEARTSIVIRNVEGLHLRVMKLIVEEAMRYESHIVLCKNEEDFEAKSMMSLMGIMASNGTRLSLRAIGPDAADAVKALKALVVKECNEKTPDGGKCEDDGEREKE